ncbi:S41 family peptidase [Spirochaetota bacterium]
MFKKFLKPRNIERFVWVLLLSLVFFINIKLPTLKERAVAAPYKNVEKYYEFFTSVFEYISRKYVDKEKATPDRLIYGAIKGMLSSLEDPHTAFLDEKRYRDLKTETSGSFGGLGIYIGKRDEWLTVIYPIEGTPAWEVGIKPGDIISEIEKESTKDMTIEDAVSILRGKPGTTVNVTVVREGEEKPLRFKIVRDDIKIKSVKSGIIEDSNIGYIKIRNFSATTPGEVKDAIVDIKKKKMTSLIVDLRYNPGGLLDVVCTVADFFIDDGLIVYTKGRDSGFDSEYRASKELLIPKYIPIVVLINNYSASASEILAGALQDTKRAILLGEKTFGKFSVQQVQQIDPTEGTAFRITTAYYYTPNGRSLHEEGIAPDVLVKSQGFTSYENKMISKLLKGKYLSEYVKKYPDVKSDEKHLSTLIEEIEAHDIDVRKDVLEMFLTRERNRKKMPPLYDMTAPDAIQLKEAINLLKGYKIFKQQPD